MKNKGRLFYLACAYFNQHSIKSESQKDGRIQIELNKSVKGFWDSRMFQFLAIGINRKSLVVFFLYYILSLFPVSTLFLEAFCLQFRN